MRSQNCGPETAASGYAGIYYWKFLDWCPNPDSEPAPESLLVSNKGTYDVSRRSLHYKQQFEKETSNTTRL